MDDGLSTCFKARGVVSEGVEARLGGVDLDHNFELGLTTAELVLPKLAVWLALLKDERLGVLSIGDHLLDEVRLVNMWSQSRLVVNPSWCKPSGNASSHFVWSFSKINDYNFGPVIPSTTLHLYFDHKLLL